MAIRKPERQGADEPADGAPKPAASDRDRARTRPGAAPGGNPPRTAVEQALEEVTKLARAVADEALVAATPSPHVMPAPPAAPPPSPVPVPPKTRPIPLARVPIAASRSTNPLLLAELDLEKLAAEIEAVSGGTVEADSLLSELESFDLDPAPAEPAARSALAASSQPAQAPAPAHEPPSANDILDGDLLDAAAIFSGTVERSHGPPSANPAPPPAPTSPAPADELPRAAPAPPPALGASSPPAESRPPPRLFDGAGDVVPRDATAVPVGRVPGKAVATLKALDEVLASEADDLLEGDFESVGQALEEAEKGPVAMIAAAPSMAPVRGSALAPAPATRTAAANIIAPAPSASARHPALAPARALAPAPAPAPAPEPGLAPVADAGNLYVPTANLARRGSPRRDGVPHLVAILQVLNYPLRLVPPPARLLVDWLGITLLAWVVIVWAVVWFNGAP